MIIGSHSRSGSAARQVERVFGAFCIFFIATSPLNNSYEIAAMMSGTLVASESLSGASAWTATLTPVYIKALKDVFLFATVLLACYACLRWPKKTRIFLAPPFLVLNVFLVLLLLTALYSFTFMPASIVLAGIRGYWSILFVYAGALFFAVGEERIYSILLIVFAIDFSFQIIQFLTDVGYSVYFEHRSPGLFIIPATAGGFALLIHYVGIRMRSNAVKLVSIGSLLLSNSTTGLLCLIAYYVFSFRNKFKPKIVYYPIFASGVLLTAAIVFENIGSITGRGGGATLSLLTRVGLIYAALTNWSSLIVGQGMGVATSQALLLDYSGARIADNTFIGLLYNAGIVPAMLMLLFIVFSYRLFSNKLLYFQLLGYSMTTVVFEINPVIQILLIFLGIQIGSRYALNQGPRVVRSRLGQRRSSKQSETLGGVARTV